ncbi:MAG: CADD family putative folate metabolism protein [Candidatus Marinimicrobia bacterium]|nr:CADD family putative folate metabolism protein [Candidatus Neomarinimicrobiota bacterium]
MKDTNIMREIDIKIKEKDLLDHPFYQAWSEGTLSIEALQGYAKQYYKFVSAFPRYLSSVHSNCDDLKTRQFILENLSEEENLEKPHQELWIQFGEALSLSREEITEAESFPETEEALGILKDICRNASYTEGSAALYAYESRVPEIASVKIEGLQKFYNIGDKTAIEYFELHKDVDILHAEIWRKILNSAKLSAEERENLVRATGKAMSAYNLILDGVQREYAVA